jgi:hypothetical protein
MQIEDYNYFDQHRKELAAQYPDKWLLIKDKQVLFAVDTLKEAVNVSKTHGLEDEDCLIDFCRKDGKKRILKVRQSYYFSYV